MSGLAVSVIVVSWGRPESLRRTLAGIAQLDYPMFEVVVVADEAGRAVVPDGMKVVPCDEPNIALARNLGVAAAAGEVVAFIDDDAVPEPTWLTYLCAPLVDATIANAGGFVLGRNGISYQWQARMAFPDGTAVPMTVDPDKPTVLRTEPGRAIKTEGTNMAFRRDRLVALGGFDPTFAFYLDETDVNMCLAAERAKTVITPRALVHHGMAASARRTADRVPRDLTAIGRSLHAFINKHAPKTDKMTVMRAERAAQHARLLRAMRDGFIMPGQVKRILRSFDAGWQDETAHRLAAPAYDSPPPFLAFAGFGSAGTKVLCGRFWQAKRLFAQARESVAKGQRVTVFLFSLSNAYHRVYFHPDGFWVQTGGQFGKSARSGRFFQLWGAKSRLRHEIARVSCFRELDTVT